ncbi:MAG TPA: NADP-dependent oxidoreductase [Steroidobacteraceae bacterium]|nr:NADP-dependent oxidoreductase [Steroidobacteraceae bacterium]
MNRRVVLAKRPQPAADLACFGLESVPMPTLAHGQVLLRTIWLSLDPYMRGRMSDAPSYAAPVPLGGVMTGQTVARVESSLNADYRVGDLVLAASGWQEFAVSDGRDLTRLPAGLEHPSWALGVLGMTGFTAYTGLLDIGKPTPGETVAVAAATGAVGSIVGQIAKLQGCRVVGIAGGAEKCGWAVNELGFDACVDHRAPALEESLAAACPRGIDVYFENVGGRIFRAVVPLLNAHARIPVCGLIAQYDTRTNSIQSDFTPALMRTILVKRITMRGFIIYDDDAHRFDEFLTSMQAWLRDGRVKYREDVVRGLENAPRAFLGLLEGRNFGKLVVRVGAEQGAGT